MSYAEDPNKTSSNYRISIGRAEEHVRETSPAVLMAEATIPVTTPIKEEKGIDDLRVIHVKVKDRNRNSKTMKAPSSGRGDWACPKERRSTHVVLVVMIEGMASVRSQPFETLKPHLYFCSKLKIRRASAFSSFGRVPV
ncbi:hypothetical protein TNCV_4691591 [Trichonephila clavipes]|nr:hypothetical protein TNCV_4691591 [Trichonephila clavipes]